MNIRYDIARSETDLLAIRSLQAANIPASITSDELQKQGFVTVIHDQDILREMNEPYPHVLARHDSEIVGYALVMLPAFSHRLPVLIPMFERIGGLSYQGVPLADSSWFVMGQICIQKDYRGQGLVWGMYAEMKNRMAADFDYVITQISRRNPRSIRAHEKAGFRSIHSYYDDAAREDWEIVLWDWK